MGQATGRIQCLSFVDSEPAKFGLIKGMSDTRPCDILIRNIALWDSEATPWIWYSRGPSFSNIADDPSRLLFDKFAKEFPEALLCDALDYIPPPSEFEMIARVLNKWLALT